MFAVDEARIGLKVWHRRRWCSKGDRPPYAVRDRYRWLWLYAAVEPTTGESFCLYMPHLDGTCASLFLQKLEEAYPGEDLLVVWDGAGAHRSHRIRWSRSRQGMLLPPYSPDLNPAERWFQEMRRRLSNQIFPTLTDLEAALTEALRPYWEQPERLAQLTGYPWWLDACAGMRTS